MIIDLATHETKYVTPVELADYWRMDVSTIYRLIEKGALAADRIGPKLWRIRTVDALRMGKPSADLAH